MRRRIDRLRTDNAVPDNHRHQNMARACLIVSVFVYLGFAAVSARWIPNEPFIAYIFIFFAAHTAAYLLLKEIRGYDNKNAT